MKRPKVTYDKFCKAVNAYAAYKGIKFEVAYEVLLGRVIGFFYTGTPNQEY